MEICRALNFRRPTISDPLEDQKLIYFLVALICSVGSRGNMLTMGWPFLKNSTYILARSARLKIGPWIVPTRSSPSSCSDSAWRQNRSTCTSVCWCTWPIISDQYTVRASETQGEPYTRNVSTRSISCQVAFVSLPTSGWAYNLWPSRLKLWKLSLKVASRR